ncbi:MAG: hypothetical protein IPO87_07680 [Flavobacteriales bacterium]|nr:hypothetical protein [Flavobacteriales bacterium]
MLNCNVSSIMLVGTGNGTFAWSGPNGFSSTVQTRNVGAAGTYNPVVTGANGRTGDAFNRSNTGCCGARRNCTRRRVELQREQHHARCGNRHRNLRMERGPNGFSSTVQNPNVGAAGIYNLLLPVRTAAQVMLQPK